ncbi:hypothetical protein, partial [Actinoplanes palleronii]|uniref:hypothetical protein n=1 Tax=Actinoplanes palleronii TaxID=113570 RepID=UPI0031D4AF4B
SVKGSLRINMFPPPAVSTTGSMRDTLFLTRHRNDDKRDVNEKMTAGEVSFRTDVGRILTVGRRHSP